MKKIKLGRSGPEITRVGFGAWTLSGPSKFGWGPVDDGESIRTIRHAIEEGINWVDTAAFYGRGHSEEVVGRAIEPWKAGEDLYVFSKCGLTWQPADDPDTPPVNSLRPESIRYECDQSLRRLRVDRIDVYQFHWPDVLGTPVEDSWATMVELVEAGKVRWIGVSNFGLDLLQRCEAVRPVDTLQPPLNLIDRRARDVLIPYAKKREMGVIVYSPMASGLLSGGFDRSRIRSLPETDWRKSAPHFGEPELSKNLTLVQELEVIAGKLDTTLPALAIAWCLSVPGVHGAIAGARHPAQVDGWLAAADLDLTPDTLREIERAIEVASAGPDSPIVGESPKAREGIA